MREIQVFPEADSLAKAAADLILRQAKSCLAERKRFNLILSGGSTPLSAYRLLASPQYAGRIDWGGVHIFFGDERCVPPDHPDSNFAMARQILLDHIPIPEGNVHRMHGELNPAEAAADYENELRRLFPRAEFPEFDLVLLGMGEDGHVASLFPGSMALDEKQRWVTAIEQIGESGKGVLKGKNSRLMPPLVNRLSLTLPVLNAARQVVMLVAGAKKAGRITQVFDEQLENPHSLPAQLIRPQSHQILWLVDQAAAAGIQEIISKTSQDGG